MTKTSAGQTSVIVFAADSAAEGLPVVIGVPFPRGQLKDASKVAIVGPDGSRRPGGARTLVNWPDGSARWCLTSFLANQKGQHAVQVGADGSAAADSSAGAPSLKLTRQADRTTIDNGSVRVVLSEAGPGPIQRLTALGHDYINRPEQFRLVVDAADTSHETERKITILEESPVRVRVRVEGAHFDSQRRRKLNYRLDVELWAGSPALRLDYHFFNLERGQDDLDIDRIAIECDLSFTGQTQRHVLQKVHGLLYVPREVSNPAPVAIIADDTRGSAHVEHPDMLLDTAEYNFHLRPPLIDTPEWLGVGDSQRCVYARMQDFAAMRPKRLASKDSTLTLEVWPPFAGKLRLPQGRSRRQVFTLAFANKPKLSAAEAESLLAAPAWEGRASVAPQWLAHCAEFDQDRTFTPGSNIRFEKYLRRLVQLATPQGMFDLGDTPDSGYLRTYIPIGGAQEPLPGAPPMKKVFMAGAHSPLASWAFPEFYEPVWTNNEYDVIHTLAQEVMRTGQLDHWQTLRWAARHNIEVDFIYLSDHHQQHRATPQHSARHNRSGAILSHFWTQGLLEYHCLTGDPDALEVAAALGDKIIENLTAPEMRESFWGFTRELGWPALALSLLHDITNEPRFGKQLKEIVDFFVGYDRRKFHGPLKLSSGDARYSLERQMVSGFFAYASMIEGVDNYLRRTGDKPAERWLVQMLDDLRQALDDANREGQPLWAGLMLPQAMAIGFERTGDERYLRSGMVCLYELLDSGIWLGSSGETKTVAMSYRALVRFLHHVHRNGMLQKLEYPDLP